MSDTPTPLEEIDRKAFETLQTINSDLECGKITESQFKYGIDIAWLIASGLVKKDTEYMFEVLGEEAKLANCNERKYFRHEDGRNIVITDSKKGLLSLKLIRKGAKESITKYDLREEPNPYIAGKIQAAKLVDAVKKNGFVRI